MVWVASMGQKRGKLLDNELSGSYFIVLKNPEDVHSFVQIGKIEFLAQKGGFNDLGAQYVKYEDFFGGVQLGFNIDFALCNRVGIQLETFNIRTSFGIFLRKSKGTDKKKDDKVKVFHKFIYGKGCATNI